jgi:hypothetical protein
MSTAKKKSSLGVTLFLVALIVGFVWGGVGALNTYLEQRAETKELAENRVEGDAQVLSVTTTKQFRGGQSTSLRVSFDPSGPELLEFADLTVCTEADYDEGTETVRVVHASTDPGIVALAECEGSVDSILPLVIGVLLIALGAFLVWQLVRSWTAEKE